MVTPGMREQFVAMQSGLTAQEHQPYRALAGQEIGLMMCQWRV